MNTELRAQLTGKTGSFAKHGAQALVSVHKSSVVRVAEFGLAGQTWENVPSDPHRLRSADPDDGDCAATRRSDGSDDRIGKSLDTHESESDCT